MNATKTATTKTTKTATRKTTAKRDPLARKTRAKATPAKTTVKAIEAAEAKAKKPAVKKVEVRYIPGTREAKGITATFVEHFKKGATISEALDAIIASDWTPPKSDGYTTDAKKRSYIRGYLSHAKSHGFIIPVKGAKA